MTQETWQATNGVRVVIEKSNPLSRCGGWWSQFEGSRVWFGSSRSKLHALILMSHKMKKSAKSMNWTLDPAAKGQTK